MEKKERIKILIYNKKIWFIHCIDPIQFVKLSA